MPWRSDLNPGWGKLKYVERVIDDLQDEKGRRVARCALDRFPDRCAFAVEDALLWIDLNGIARISEVTRLGFAKALEGRRLTRASLRATCLTSSLGPAMASGSSMLRTATSTSSRRTLSRCSAQERPEANHLALLDAYGFRKWPDARLFQLVEFLVHPTVRQGDEQTSLTHLLNDLLVVDRFELAESEQLSGHPVFKVRRATGGVAGSPKNLIFASTGPKPELGFVDAMNNDIAILRHVRVVIEIDGQQHYSTGAEPSAKPSPEEYARTARGDRFLRLAGYEVYRFGGYALRDDSASAVDDFFTRLFHRHRLLESS